MEILAGFVIFMLGWIKVDLAKVSQKLDTHIDQNVVHYHKRSSDKTVEDQEYE